MSDSMRPNGEAMPEDLEGMRGGATHYHPEEDGGTKIPMDESIRDSSTVQFLPKGNDSVSSELGKKSSAEFVGLRKEELAKYASDPYWVRVRVILLVIFIIAWLGMLVAAIVIIALAPKCPPRPHQEWYEKAVIYQIHPNSFKDSDKNGYGDIGGILEKVSYLRDELKVSAILLGPISPSPYLRYGYDLVSHTNICPKHYGKMTDFEDLLIALHKEDIKVILDFIPNHTSVKHKWFLKSVNSSFEEYRDYYVWKNGQYNPSGGIPDPPNNKQSVVGGSAWQWNDKRQQYYYHTYSADEPDLNLTNEAVLNELNSALTYWLDKKVDGFRVLGAQYLVDELDMRDAQIENCKLVASWRQLLHNYSESEGKSKTRYKARVLIADVDGTTADTLQFTGYMAGDDWHPAAHIATNKALVSGLNQSCASSSTCILHLVSNWTASFGNATSNWQVSNAHVSRVATRLGGVKYVNAVNLLLLTLDGTALTFYGDELGLEDVEYNKTENNRNTVRGEVGQLTPMQWSSKEYAGFTEPGIKPWIPVSENYRDTNIQTQEAYGSGVTHLELFRRLVSLRHTSESLQWGAVRGLATQASVLLYIRQAEGFPPFLVAINFGPSRSTIDFDDYQRQHLNESGSVRLPLEMKVITSTFNFEGAGRDDLFKNGTVIASQKKIHLRPTEGVVLSWEPNAALSAS